MSSRLGKRGIRIVPLVVVVVALLCGVALAHVSGQSNGTKSGSHSGAGNGKSGGGAVTTTTTTTTTPTTTTTTATTTVPRTTTATSTATNSATKHKAAKTQAKEKPPAPAVAPLTGVLGTASVWPERTVMLTLPLHVALTQANLHLSENGQPVTGETITPLSGHGSSNLGVVAVVDTSSGMRGAPLGDAMHAVSQLVGLRSQNQSLGVVTYGAKPRVLVPVTPNASTISLDLQTSVSAGGSGSKILPALSLAYKMLKQAKMPTGAVVLLTNDAQQELPSHSALPGSTTQSGRSAGYETYVVAIGPKSLAGTTSELHSLNAPLTAATGAKVGSAVQRVWGDLTRSYLVTYKSVMPHGLPVQFKATVAGVPGTVTGNYKAVKVAAPPPTTHDQAAPIVWGKHGTSQLTPAFPATPAVALPVTPVPPSPSGASTLGSVASLLPIAIVCMLLFAVSAVLLIGRRRGKQLQARVAKFINHGTTKEEDEAAAAALEAEQEPRGIHKLLQARKSWPNFIEQVEVGRFKRSPMELVTASFWVSAAVMVAIVLLTGSIMLGILGLVVGPVGLKMYVKRRAKKQRLLFSEQLPSHLHDLSGAMRAGRSFVGAIMTVSENADEPIKGEIDRAMGDEALGRPLEDALEGIAQRMGSPDMSQVALIASLHRRTGSNVAESLERVAEGARDRADLKREMQALTAQSKISSRVLSALPVCLVLAMSVIAPSYAKPMFKPVGLIVLGFCGGMVIAGWFVMKKITDVED
jgi:tight adherence protein B